MGSLGFVNSGSDIIAGTAMNNAVSSAAQGGEVPFSGIGGGNTRYNSGSHVDATGTNLLTGIANKSGSVTRGYFIEGGWSSYDTLNANDNNGSGHANYYGLGMLLKKQLKNNIYLDGSLRLGQVNSGYVNSNLTDAAGNSASYHTNSFYYSAHLGLGKVYKISETKEIDLFAKYLYSHQNGNKVEILGDTFDFKGINSNRLQLGSKYTFGKTQSQNYYVGLTYEYEMSGTARASVYGFDLPAPSLKGSSGILEVGMQIKPSKNKNYTIDLGLQGYTGKRQGFGGNVQVKFDL